MKIECYYLQGQIHGTWREFKEWPTCDNDFNLFLYEEKFYIRSKPCGIWRKWSESGELSEERPFKNGVVHGTLKSFYENGNPKRILPFINGVCNGEVYEYSKEGDVKKLIFKDGQPIFEI